MGLMRGIGAVRRGCGWRGDCEGVWWRIFGFVDSGCGSLLRLEKECSVGRVGSVIVHDITIRVLSLDRLYLESGYCAACRDPSHQDFQGSSYLEKFILAAYARITLSLKSVLPLSTTASPFFQTILLLPRWLTTLHPIPFIQHDITTFHTLHSYPEPIYIPPSNPHTHSSRCVSQACSLFARQRLLSRNPLS